MKRLSVLSAAIVLALLAIGVFTAVPKAQTSANSSDAASASASPIPLPDLPDDAPDDALATVEEDARSTLLYDAKLWAQEDGISIDEAKRRLQLQDDIAKLNGELMAEERGTFAGLHIQYEPEYSVVTRFTQNGGRTIQPYVEGGPLEDLVEVRPANSTLPELDAAQSKADRLLDSVGMTHASGTEMDINSAVVEVTDKGRLASVLQEANLSLPQEVKVREVKDLVRPSAFYAGLNIRADGEHPSFDCTSGFTVRHTITNQEGGTTAGHCKDDMSYRGQDFFKRDGEFSGPYDLKYFDTENYEDRAWIRDFSDDSTPGYRYVKSARGRGDQVTRSEATDPENSRVCHFGEGGDIPEFKCGYVVNTSYRPPAGRGYNNPENSFIKVRPAGQDISDEGDSGGPWFDGTTAVGIHSGASSDSGGSFAIYMSITYFDDNGFKDFNLIVQKVD